MSATAPAASTQPSRRRAAAALLFALALATAGCAREPGRIPNLHVVEPGTLLRGGQADAEGLRRLRDEYGVRTIVNLNDRTTEWERAAAASLGMDYIGLPMSVMELDRGQLLTFLRAVEDARARGRAPVYVHCQYGQDRTGVAVGVYRIVEQGWCADHAAAELDRYQHWTHGVLFPHLDDRLRETESRRNRWRAFRAILPPAPVERHL